MDRRGDGTLASRAHLRRLEGEGSGGRKASQFAMIPSGCQSAREVPQLQSKGSAYEHGARPQKMRLLVGFESDWGCLWVGNWQPDDAVFGPR